MSIFALYFNDLEQELITRDAEGVGTGLLKLFLLLYADDIIFFKSASGLQNGLNILYDYCQNGSLLLMSINLKSWYLEKMVDWPKTW